MYVSFVAKRVSFSLYCAYGLSVQQHSIINILRFIILKEFLRIARCTLRLTDFVPNTSQLYTRMLAQGENKASILRHIKKSFQIHLEILSKYCKTYEEIINKIIMYQHLTSTRLTKTMQMCMCVFVFVYLDVFIYVFAQKYKIAINFQLFIV